MMLTVLFTILVSFIITLISVPKIKLLGLKFELFDQPNSRKSHNTKIVRIGGLSIIFSIFLTLTILYIFNFLNINNTIEYKNFSLIFFGSILFFIIGIYDDKFNLSPYRRLIFQFTTTFILWSLGLKFEAISVPDFISEDNIYSFNNIYSLIISSIWIVGITNAINWMDGLDGLATGICLITAIGLSYLSSPNGIIEINLWLIALVGSCLGFLVYNWKPAKIFLGDGGSYFLGFSLSSISIMNYYSLESTIKSDYFFLKPFVPLLLLSIPIIDMIFVILNRLMKGKSPFIADKSHLHHRLINTGLSYQNTIFLLYGVSFTILLTLIKLVKFSN